MNTTNANMAIEAMTQ